MPVEITMPQLSDTMTEGTVVKWHKKEGDKINSGEEVADIETDKATMPMEAFDAGTLAVIVAREGQKVKVGQVIGVIATGSEKPDEIKKKYASGTATAAPKPVEAPPSKPAPAPAAKPSSAPAKPGNYQFDIVVIGGGPAGYAAAIRAGQLKKRVLCIEKESLGGTCLNWGCIPTKALLDDGAFIRKLRLHAAEHGVSYKDLSIDFPKLISRSRAIADKLSKGIEHLFRKYEVKHEIGAGQLLGPHRVKITSAQNTREVTADHIIIATGAKATPLPGVAFDGKKIITSREAMNLPRQPKKIAIIGAGAIGCEFADFYNAVGTEVVVVEMLDHLLPNEDDDVSVLLERVFAKREIDVRVKTKTDKVETTPGGVKLTLSGAKPGVVEADVVLVAIGVSANTDGLLGSNSGLEIFKGRIKADPQYQTNLPNIWAVGDCVSLHWPPQEGMGGYRHPDLAHVAHHEAVNCVERIAGVSDHLIDYKSIPGCTYTHPQVASMGMSERKARELNRKLKVGKFPFSASGRALAMGEPDGFVKLIFDAQYGELLGVHMIGENVTDILAELVVAKKLEATEAEIIEAIHPHPTFSEAIMEAAGVADGRAIHL
ncbi:MAG TPA: dihydrolipoyl dehydrogenase [Tepidisphaeraceae bacterium]|jgi:dihydrolipoamide dehydrogenase|nr:dihydrolipoyl dehydrogenase [Tepidisphaeraceae bacterium]